MTLMYVISRLFSSSAFLPTATFLSLPCRPTAVLLLPFLVFSISLISSRLSAVLGKPLDSARRRITSLMLPFHSRL